MIEKHTSIAILSKSELELVHGGEIPVPTATEIENAIDIGKEVGEALAKKGVFNKLGVKGAAFAAFGVGCLATITYFGIVWINSAIKARAVKSPSAIA